MNLVVTRAPFRVSFAGGGTDLPTFYERESGAVLSATIDKYVYVMINRRNPLFKQGIRFSQSPLGSIQGNEQPPDPFQYPIRVSYSSTENVHSIDELQHPIVREALRFLDIDEALEISTMADVPAGTGLGSSSTFAVALLHALHLFKGDRVAPDKLASEAAHLEVNVLGRPIGKQDHYAAAFGGFNLFRFLPNGEVEVESVGPEIDAQNHLFPYLMLLYTGVCRDASAILSVQKANVPNKLVDLVAMKNHAYKLHNLARNGFNPTTFGKILHESWIRKRALAPGVSNSRIDRYYEGAMRAGALGGKICGAGGGGFLLLVVAPDKRASVRAAAADLAEMEFRFERSGSEVLIR
jgi:D-glycero-alpha-D-manno-heptose-7-phosphate kinase